MAKPVNAIEVWAHEDFILPGTNDLNKKRPIDDLWAKGYDMDEQPGVEEWNYVWNLTTSWIKYLSEDVIDDLENIYLKKELNLGDLENKAKARENLGVFSKTESDGRFVNVEGDTMTGTLTVPRVNFPASQSDYAWIETVVPPGTTDTTYLDFGIGDNVGDKNAQGVDIMRWRFLPPQGNTFSLMELNASAINKAFLEVYGDVRVRDGLLVDQGIRAGGEVNAVGNINTQGALTAKYARVDGTIDIRNPNNQSQVATHNADGNISGSIWGGNLKDYIDNRTELHTTSNGFWWRDKNTGFIHQCVFGNWRSYAQEDFETVTFPVAFPSECFSVNVSAQIQGENVKTDVFGQSASWDRFSARVTTQWSGTNWEVGSRAVVWAVGR